MLQDAQGLDVSTNSPETVAAIDTFVDQFLGYGLHADAILKGVEADPDCAIANAYAAALYMFLENAEAPQLARPYLEKALAGCDDVTERERMNVEAVAAWVDGRFDDAIRCHEEIAEHCPRDICSVKFGQYHLFNRGDSEGMLRLAEMTFMANDDNPYMHGMLAFGLEQCHRLDEAEAAARTATEMQRREPWAHHAVAHVMITQGRTDEGIAWMESLSDTWEDCNSFMITHNWWHLALFYMDKGVNAKALELYDSRVWGVWKEYSQDQIGAISLLWRLELAGCDVGDRWQDVADYVQVRTKEHIEPFLDLQYIYCLARAGRADKVDEMLTSMRTFAGGASSFVATAWREVALPAAEGFVAYANGDIAAARHKLESVHNRMQEIGGSHAQRDLFDQTWINVLMRTGSCGEAAAILEDRIAFRPSVAPPYEQLADAYAGAGDAAKAEAVRARAAELAA